MLDNLLLVHPKRGSIQEVSTLHDFKCSNQYSSTVLDTVWQLNLFYIDNLLHTLTRALVLTIIFIATFQYTLVGLAYLLS
jgi:hypothetical protein